MLRYNACGLVPPPTSLYEGGQAQILAEPFEKHTITVDMIDSNQGVWILLDFMNQKIRTQVTVDQLQLSKQTNL